MKDFQLQRSLTSSFVFFLICGGISTLFDWGSFYLANYIIKLHYLMAVSLSFSIGSIFNFFSNKYLTFKNYYNKITLQMGVFYVGVITALFLTWVQMFIFINYIHLSPMVSRMVTTFIILIYNFIYHSFITFGKLK